MVTTVILEAEVIRVKSYLRILKGSEDSYMAFRHLKKHMMFHKRSHECRTCGKSFSHPGLLKHHKVSHTGDMPYKCDICKDAFAWAWGLKKHMKTHSEENGDNQPSSSHLLTDRDTKTFKCNICEKHFAMRHYLKRHMQKHS